MLKYFRSSQIPAALAVIAIGVILWAIPILSDTRHLFQFDVLAMPLYRWLIWLIPNNAIISNAIALILVFIMGFYLLRLNAKYVIIKQRSYLPVLLFVLLVSAIIPFQRVTPAILAGLCVEFSLYYIYSIYQSKNPLDSLFRAGLLLGIASLFYAPAIIMSLVLFIGQLVLRPFSIREWTVALLGLILPLVTYLFVLFYFDTNPMLAFDLYSVNLSIEFFPSIGTVIPLVFFACIAPPLLIALAYLIPSLSKQKISVRKFNAVNFYLLLLVVLTFIAVPGASYELIFIAAIPLSFQLANLFTNAKATFWLQLLFVLMFVGALLGQMVYFAA